MPWTQVERQIEMKVERQIEMKVETTRALCKGPQGSVLAECEMFR
jgi:hypothetical protein